MPDRIYNEEEVAKLLKRAAEMEAERSVSRDNGFKNGLSLEELAQIASESGIDPELVQKAAIELDSYGGNETSSKRDARIKRDEIVCERWLDINPDSRTLDELVTELNHMYGTSDQDVSWWDKLWDDYSGKAKVRKTATSLEWTYTDEYGYYTTRVLLQKRANKFRIRVSERQFWGFEWNTRQVGYTLIFPVLVVFAISGAMISSFTLNSIWPGILAGTGVTLITLASIYLYNFFNKRHVNKHKNRVIETADELAQLAIQLSSDNRKKNSDENRRSGKSSDAIEIEIRDQEESANNSSLKQMLREK